MQERLVADGLLKPRSVTKSVNCLGYAFYLAGLTRREGNIIPQAVDSYAFLEEVPIENAVFIAAVYGTERTVAHIAFIDPNDRAYVYHRYYGGRGRQTIDEAMRAYRGLGSGFTEVYLGVREGIRREKRNL